MYWGLFPHLSSFGLAGHLFARLYFINDFFLPSIIDGLQCLPSNLRPGFVLHQTCEIVPLLCSSLAHTGVGGEEMTDVGGEGAGYVSQGGIVLVTRYWYKTDIVFADYLEWGQ